jgi:hypothetical protein
MAFGKLNFNETEVYKIDQGSLSIKGLRAVRTPFY